MASQFLRALDLALDLPKTPREQPINVGQLRMLAEIADVRIGLDRHELLARETHDKPTVDARIIYLRRKGLIEAIPKSHYHDSEKYQATSIGKTINRALRGKQSAHRYRMWLDRWIELPILKRKAPINAGLLKVHALVEYSPKITTTELLEHFLGAKPTLKARLRWLERKGLIGKYPKFNAGGNGNPDYFIALPNIGQVHVRSIA
jgi:hypothetical protein